jgi:hypothetical protein
MKCLGLVLFLASALVPGAAFRATDAPKPRVFILPGPGHHGFGNGKTSSSVQPARSSAEDVYWQLLGRGKLGLIDSNHWVSDQLALTLDGMTV